MSGNRGLNLILLCAIIILSGSGCGKGNEDEAIKSPPKRDQDRAVEILAESLQSSDPALRALALEAYDDLDKAPPAGPLSVLLNDERPSLRFMAVRLKADQATRDQVTYFDRVASKDEDASVRLAGVYGMCRLGDFSRIEELAKGLSSENETVRRNAAMLLGLLENRSAAAMLRGRLSDSDPLVQLNAAEAMARLGDKSGLGVIRELARQHGHPYQVYALLALGRVGVPERDIQFLRDLVRLSRHEVAGSRANSKPRYSVAGMIAAFGARIMLGDPMQAYWLAEMIGSEGPGGQQLAAPERAFALQMLARASYAPAWREVVKSLDDKDKYVRTSAAWALQSYNIPRVSKLIEAMGQTQAPDDLPEDRVLSPAEQRLGPATHPSRPPRGEASEVDR